jgi:hypothetical protein
MSTTVTTKTGYASRIGGAFRALPSALILFAIGTVLLWWNEGRAVRTQGAIEEAARAVVEMPDPSVRDPAFDGRLVHATALATATAVLSDARFGVEAPAHSLSLASQAEIYQWVETSESKSEKKLGGSVVTTTVYDYRREWCSTPQRSDGFRESGHENRQILPASLWEDKSVVAQDATFGAYRLPESFAGSIGRAEPVILRKTAEETAALQAALFGVAPTPVVPAPEASPRTPAEGESAAPAEGEADAAENEAADAPAPPGTDSAASAVPQKVFLLADGTVYLGLDPSVPAIGDVRITFLAVPESEASLIAQVSGETFVPFVASNGKSFSRVATGVHSAEEMIESARQGNRILSWLLRLGGFFLVFLAFRVLLAPLAVLADVVPFLGSILSFGTGLVSSAAALAWSLLVVAIAWIRFRPLLGAGLLALAAALVAFVFLRKRKQAAG